VLKEISSNRKERDLFAKIAEKWGIKNGFKKHTRNRHKNTRRKTVKYE
jgi:hypothetical protein